MQNDKEKLTNELIVKIADQLPTEALDELLALPENEDNGSKIKQILHKYNIDELVMARKLLKNNQKAVENE